MFFHSCLHSETLTLTHIIFLKVVMKRQEKDIPPKEKCYLETEYPAYLILGMFYFLYNSIIKRYMLFSKIIRCSQTCFDGTSVIVSVTVMKVYSDLKCARYKSKVLHCVGKQYAP